MMKSILLCVITTVLAAFVIAGCEAAPGGSGAAPSPETSGQTSAAGESVDLGGEDYVDNYEDMTPSCITVIRVGDMPFSVDMESNRAAKEFVDKINHEALTVRMHDYGDFEKVGDLPWSLPTDDKEITTRPGDLILYQGNKITVYYGENTWNFTKLGHLNATPEEIEEYFGGKDDITAEFFVEWTE